MSQIDKSQKLSVIHLLLLCHGKNLVSTQPMAVGHPHLKMWTLVVNVVCDILATLMIHLLSSFSTHRVKAAITVLTPHLTQVQIVQRHLKVHSSSKKKGFMNNSNRQAIPARLSC